MNLGQVSGIMRTAKENSFGNGNNGGKQNDDRLENGDSGSSGKVEKEKAGFYLTKEVIDNLELVWVQTRSLTGNRISKSDIVNFALKNLIEEFREDPEEHQLVQKWSS